MGIYDSSLTRVLPVFETLLNRDLSGTSWLPILLDLAGQSSTHEHLFLDHIGNIVPKEEGYFEIPVPPPERFLTWLVINPDKMKWPLQSGQKKKFGPTTQDWREKLFGLHGEENQTIAIEEAADNIKTYGSSKSRRRWWAFEGFTTVDCCLETDELLLFIEGKRKDTLSRSTAWYDERNQLSRNLEVCKELSNQKEYGVILICEEAPDSNILTKSIRRGLPHLNEDEKKELLAHFFGYVLWKDLCRATNLKYSELPDSILG